MFSRFKNLNKKKKVMYILVLIGVAIGCFVVIGSFTNQSLSQDTSSFADANMPSIQLTTKCEYSPSDNDVEINALRITVQNMGKRPITCEPIGGEFNSDPYTFPTYKIAGLVVGQIPFQLNVDELKENFVGVVGNIDRLRSALIWRIVMLCVNDTPDQSINIGNLSRIISIQGVCPQK